MKKILPFCGILLFFASAPLFLWQAEASGYPSPDPAIKNPDAMSLVETGSYNFDKAHSFIGFKVKHLGLIEVPGYFRDFTGTVNFDAKNPSSSTVTFTAKVASVDTGVAARDNHLKTADFFDAEKFPEIQFVSKKVEKTSKGWLLTGDLTMKGVTKSVSIPFEISGWLPAGDRNPAKMGIAGETKLNRRDFGINYGNNLPSGIPAISDEVKIVLQIEAAKAK
ncbi:MAG TPA: YceI family protein [Pyrinomonadaceae bacterium]|jgi:polyisoprenoid-binding protein YceI|nr:YceI family protein [Pyrinomonadaceae bacterium]